MEPEIQEALTEGLNARSEAEHRLIVKAWEDDAFRQELLSDPKAVYAREFGHPVPEGLEIEVVEETPGTLKMVLPSKPIEASADGELSDEALEAVAGGKWAVATRRDWVAWG